jgi:hypothetical protein
VIVFREIPEGPTEAARKLLCAFPINSNSGRPTNEWCIRCSGGSMIGDRCYKETPRRAAANSKLPCPKIAVWTIARLLALKS